MTFDDEQQVDDTHVDGLQEARQAPPHTLILFGATGDLSKRKLLPALYNLHRDGLLPEAFAMIGCARSKLNDDEFRQLVRSSIDEYSRHSAADDEKWDGFVARFYYCNVDVSTVADFDELKQTIASVEQKHTDTACNRMFYLAMAPQFFGTVATNLKQAGLATTTGWQRLIIEKPFGRDRKSAESLNTELRQVFEEEEIYRIDHYLGKEMVQNIEVIRFANSMFEPVWNNRSIANIQITSSETVGVEERASYYDKAGALRDMVQNHMLQMVMMMLMEPPSRLKTEAIRDEKVKVLRSLRPYTTADAHNHVVRGQYAAGNIGDKALPGYCEEPSVAPESNTETFIAARLFVDNFRWAGVPIYIRTGKRMAVKSTEIVVQFRDMPKNLYFNRDGQLGPNLLVIRVTPAEGMYIQLNAKRPGSDAAVVPVAMEFSQHSDDSPEAYERLLLDAMHGDSTFFTRWDEVGLAWKFVDPIAEAFQSDAVPLDSYAAGSWGPSRSEELLTTEGFKWWPVYGQETPSVETLLERTHTKAVEVK